MGDQVKLKIELGDYKFECKGSVETMIELAVWNRFSSRSQ